MGLPRVIDLHGLLWDKLHGRILHRCAEHVNTEKLIPAGNVVTLTIMPTTDLSTADDVLSRIYNENPDHWPYGLTRNHFDGGLWLLHKQASGEVAGFVGWQDRKEADGRKIGYYAIGVLPEFRRHGLAKEAVSALISRKAAGVDEVRALIRASNGPSLALARDLGVPITKVADVPGLLVPGENLVKQANKLKQRATTLALEELMSLGLSADEAARGVAGARSVGNTLTRAGGGLLNYGMPVGAGGVAAHEMWNRQPDPSPGRFTADDVTRGISAGFFGLAAGTAADPKTFWKAWKNRNTTDAMMGPMAGFIENLKRPIMNKAMFAGASLVPPLVIQGVNVANNMGSATDAWNRVAKQSAGDDVFAFYEAADKSKPNISLAELQAAGLEDQLRRNGKLTLTKALGNIPAGTEIFQNAVTTKSIGESLSNFGGTMTTMGDGLNKMFHGTPAADGKPGTQGLLEVIPETLDSFGGSIRRLGDSVYMGSGNLKDSAKATERATGSATKTVENVSDKLLGALSSTQGFVLPTAGAGLGLLAGDLIGRNLTSDNEKSNPEDRKAGRRTRLLALLSGLGLGGAAGVAAHAPHRQMIAEAIAKMIQGGASAAPSVTPAATQAADTVATAAKETAGATKEVASNVWDKMLPKGK